jgi:general secretion pathway protein E
MVPAEVLRAAAAGALAVQLPARYLEEQQVIPLQVADDGVLLVAAGRALDATVTDALAARFGRAVRVLPAEPQDVQAALLGATRDSAADVSAAGNGAAGDDAAGPFAAGEDAMGDLRARAQDAPVVQVVNALLGDALARGASDVHVESTRDGLRVRLRLDGVLRDVATYPSSLQAGVLSRLKLLAQLDIAERRLPQDGRARVRLGAREVDLRVSTLPALHGEGMVLRVLDQGHTGAAPRSLADLGMPPQVRASFEPLVRRNAGLILVTGPTGSGKTTTLYAALALRNDPGVKIVTVEDPVEYQVAGVTQVPVNRKAGLGFANVLRSILRHDPDVIMVGEMRDRETAEVAVQAALTGHLVFSTLHTTNAPGAVTRLVDMGIEPYLVAATVQGVLAQRLVRVTCAACAAPIPPNDEALLALRAPQHHAGWGGARRGAGCPACGGTGYRGRVGLYELYLPDEGDRRRLATRGALTGDDRGEQWGGARSARVLVSLQESGMRLVLEGVTTPEEVRRVLSLDDPDPAAGATLPPPSLRGGR